MTVRAERQRNARMFSDALIEAFERKYNEALDASTDLPLTDETCLAAERRFAEYHRHRRLRTALVAAIVAAAMLLCGCTAYVYREQIADFLLEHTTFYINVSHGSEAISITDPASNYGLSYVPEGYELVEEKKHSVGASCIWRNSESQRIIFSQNTLYSKASVDNECLEKYTIESDDRTILCFEVEEKMYQYMWSDGCFSFTIRTNEKFSDEEILRMVDSMTVIE